MIAPTNSHLAALINTTKVPSADHRKIQPLDDRNDPGWFLPLSASSRHPIHASQDTALQNLSPENLATRVLAHIAA